VTDCDEYADEIRRQLRESADLKTAIAADPALVETVSQMTDAIITCLINGGVLYTFGNGGSAADAQHIAGELVGRFKRERGGLACVALTTDSSVVTSIANDYGFDSVFVRQVDAMVREGDAVLAISTSGESENVIRAVELARARKAVVLALSGNEGGRLAQLADICLTVPSADTPRIQECHGIVVHILCGLVEEKLCESERGAAFPGCKSIGRLKACPTLNVDGKRRAVFLDRDGTVNRDVSYLCSADQLEPLPGAIEALRLLGDAGFLRIIVTNQSAVARGMITIEKLGEIHATLVAMIRNAGADIDAIYFCPHYPEGSIEEYAIKCDCRKPMPGMLLRAAKEFDIDLRTSFMVGDRPADIEAGKRAGCSCFFITNGINTDLATLPPGQQPDFVVDSLLAAARIITDSDD